MTEDQNTHEESEFEERGRLIEGMLDKLNPIPADASERDRDAIEIERQSLVGRTNWGSMPIEELRRVAGAS